MDTSHITEEQIEDAAKTFISIESAAEISRKHVREKLEEIFKLDKGALTARKHEINAIVQNIVRDLLEEQDKITSNKTIRNVKTKDEQLKDDDDDNNNNSNDVDDVSKGDAPSKKRRVTSIKEVHDARKKQSKAMTKKSFMENAEALNFELSEDVNIHMKPRVFSTGSCGWHVTERYFLPVGNKDVLCHICFNVTILNSKEWK